MSGLDDIKAPIPLKNKTVSQLKGFEMKNTRCSSSLGDDSTKRQRLLSPETGIATQLRARSSTPRAASPRLLNGMDSEDVLKQRLKHYNLDFVEDKTEHLKNIYDPSSKWFGRAVKPPFPIEECLPYKTESHKDQARYLCHVLVNLYIAIGSLDIQGLINISSKDLAELKTEIDNLALSTDLFRLSNDISDSEVANNDIADFDDGEDEDDEYDENEYIDTVGPDFNATGKITAKSASIINVNHWTNEFKNCMHFEFPITLRKSIATVYYYLSLVQGQKVYRQMHVDMFTTLVTTDDDGTNFTDLLLEAGLKLDHKVMLEFLTEFLPYPDPDYVRYDVTLKEDLQLLRLLLKLAHSAKAFYDEEDANLLNNVMEILLSSLAPSTMSTVMPVITSFVPYHYHEDSKITDYLPFCFSFWSSINANIGVDTHMYDLMGTVTEDAHWRLLNGTLQPELIPSVHSGDYLIFTEEQMSFMFNRSQNHLRSDGQIHSFSRTVRPLVFALKGSKSDPFFEKLTALTKSVETFVHPSNSGFWTKPISKFVHGYIKMYHSRVKNEEKTKEGPSDIRLTPECHSKLVDIFLNLLLLGAQNKNTDVANHYISCFAYLLDLSPSNSNLIYDRILTDIYEALAGEYVNSTHRLIAALKQFNRVIRYMVEDKLYRVHVTNVLLMMVSKIDMNDIQLTSNIINGIVSIASFIPFENFVKDEEYLTFESHTLPFIEQHYFHFSSAERFEKFAYDEQILQNAFIASTTIFENILRIYVDKLFLLTDVDLEEGFVTKVNQTTIIMQESMDEKTFNSFAELLQKRLWDNDFFREKNPKFELITIPLSALVRRNSKLSSPLFHKLIYHIREQIEKGAGSVRGSTEIQQRDLRLVLYLSALNEVLRQAHESVLEYSGKLIESMLYIYENITNPPLDVITSIIIHSSCATLTNTEVVDYRLFPEDSNISPLERWGGLQFDDRKFNKENIRFKWHTPNSAEISLAIQILETFIEHSISQVENLMAQPVSDANYVDKMQKYILIITHALSGSSLLFDPDFNKNKPHTADSLNYRERLLLLKNIRDCNCDSQELDIDIEQIRSSKGDDDYLDDKEVDLKMLGDETDAIEMRDTTPDNIIMNFGADVSEAPSGIATPEPGSHFEGGVSSMMNSRLVFRDLDIYTCNYPFGVTATEKLLHPQYLQVHKIRAKIGRFFRKVYLFLSKKYENNTAIFQILLHGLKVWFTDVGQETIFNEDPSASLDLDFLENIQALANLTEPFTRTCLAVRANDFHQTRVLLRSTNRYPSALETELLKDIINLASSVYPDIHKPAQGTLVHCMKQFVGSYSIIIKSVISSLKSSLDTQDYMKLEVVLKVLMIKKINRKLVSDYKNLKELVLILIRCCKVNDFEIAMHADKILSDVVSGLKIPSSVCILDEKALSILSPPDHSINLQVQAVKLAKGKKRDYYFSLIMELQKELIKILNTEENVGWKLPVFIMRFISKIQSNLETKVDREAIELIFRQTESRHPDLIHLALKSFLGTFNKVLSLADYNYDITNAYRTTFDPDHIFQIDTSDVKAISELELERENFKDPKFYIDSKMFVGWLCWGAPMKAMKPETIHLTFEDNELEALTCIGGLITNEWLEAIVSNLIQDNESHGVFSSGNVSFFVLVLFLISKGFMNMPFSNILQICRQSYNRYDKASMIMSIEILAALMCSSKYLDSNALAERDSFIEEFLPSCLDHELNQDAFGIWATVCWWLPTVVDLRRCGPFYHHFSNIEHLLDTKADDPAHQASKLLMLRSIFISLEYRTPEMERTLELLVMDHPYDQVREAVAKILATIIQNQSCPSWRSISELQENETCDSSGLGTPLRRMPTTTDAFIKQLFVHVAEENGKTDGLTPQQILKTKYFYLTSTIIYWIKEMARGPNKILLVPYIIHYVAPFLMQTLKHKDVCKLTGLEPSMLYVGLSYLPIRKENIHQLVELLCDTSKMTSSHQIKLQLQFVQHFFSTQLLQLTKNERNAILDVVCNYLYHEKFIEVRMKASEVLSDIVHNLGDRNDKLNELVQRFDQGLGQYTWEQKKAISKTNVHVHGSILGLGAIISAFPYVFPLPIWIPKQLSELSSWARTNGVAGAAAKSVISEFKKVRTDTWKFDRLSFSSEELEDLEGVLWSSYYA